MPHRCIPVSHGKFGTAKAFTTVGNEDLINNGADIIIPQEHWLWLFELSILTNVHPHFTYCAVSDRQLNL